MSRMRGPNGLGARPDPLGHRLTIIHVGYENSARINFSLKFKKKVPISSLKPSFWSGSATHT